MQGPDSTSTLHCKYSTGWTQEHQHNDSTETDADTDIPREISADCNAVLALNTYAHYQQNVAFQYEHLTWLLMVLYMCLGWTFKQKDLYANCS